MIEYEWKLGSDSPVELGEILQEVGFSNTEIGFKYNFGLFELSATRGLDPFRGDVYHFYSYYVTPRRFGELEFTIPSFVDSYEQGVAFIYYYLRNAPFKRDIKDHIYFEELLWLLDGYNNINLLPWEKAKMERQKKSEALKKIPRAKVEYDYIKIIVKKLKLLIAIADDNHLTRFSFDGDVLKIVCGIE